MKRMVVKLVAVAALIAMIALFASTLRAGVTPDQVNTALRNGIRHLKKKQKADGSWPPYGGVHGGLTSLCTLALLHAGVEPDDESVSRALHWLRTNQLDKTYAVSLQTMVFCKAKPEIDRPLIQRNVEWLEKVQVLGDKYRGGWSYPTIYLGKVVDSADNSNSQFALLALGEAERAGARVDERTWRLAKAYWATGQNINGSWGYKRRAGNNQYPGTGSMTCAGIASMIIINDATGRPDASISGKQIRCCRRPSEEDRSIEKGMTWLTRHFSVTRNTGQAGNAWVLYYLYGVERVGRMTAQRFIGRHDWYREGAEHLIHWNQKAVDMPVVVPDYWVGRRSAETNSLVATSLAMLFLSKGRRPVLMAKAQHPPDDDWNQHRHDVANLTRYVESQWKHDMTWQVVDLELASIDDLIQSPVIFLSGRRNPMPSGEAAKERMARKLRGYLDRGGFLLAEPTCNGQAFEAGFRDLMRRVFPEREYQLRMLDPSHPIWRAEQPVPPEYLRPLLGIEFGCRTSVVYAPLDPPNQPRPSLSCLWELSCPARGTKYPKSIQAQIAAARSLGINILAYATNRELQYKNPSIPVHSDDNSTTERGRLAIAKLRHPGGCNAAPRALVRLLEEAENKLKIPTVAEQRLIGLNDDALFNYHLVFMHGRTAFRLTPTERKRLAEYIKRGGMVMADSICASRAFTESFRREMAAVFPDKKLTPLAPTDPLLTTTYGGEDLKTVTRNDPDAKDAKGPIRANRRKVAPTLEGIKIDGRWAVIFSPYDISCALERHNSLECRGYTREDAARLALNVLLYSLQQ